MNAGVRQGKERATARTATGGRVRAERARVRSVATRERLRSTRGKEKTLTGNRRG